MAESYEAASLKVRLLHSEIKASHLQGTPPGVEKLQEWRQAAATTAKACILQERRIAAERLRHKVEAAIVLEELRSELVSREANAARTAERFRILAERSESAIAIGAYERAVRTAETVDAAISALSSQPPLGIGSGCVALMQEDVNE